MLKDLPRGYLQTKNGLKSTKPFRCKAWIYTKNRYTSKNMAKLWRQVKIYVDHGDTIDIHQQMRHCISCNTAKVRSDFQIVFLQKYFRNIAELQRVLK